MYKKILLLLLVFILTGCNKEDYYICTIDIDNNEQNYTLTGTYKIYYEKEFVTKIEKEETYESNDLNVIEYFDEYKNLDYANLNDLYGGFIYNITNEETRLLLSATITLENVDIKKMLKNGYLDKDYVLSNKLTTSGAKCFYKSKGAVCN